MKRKIPSHRAMRPLASDLGPEDGLDPRLERPDFSGRGPGRKVLQLCGQVARTLNEALAESADDVLRDLTVVSVIPAPSSVRVLVTVAITRSAQELTAEEALTHLHQAAGWLRTEVGSSISRRKVPELSFRIQS
jgi:ribosome-binding factor A